MHFQLDSIHYSDIIFFVIICNFCSIFILAFFLKFFYGDDNNNNNNYDF